MLLEILKFPDKRLREVSTPLSPEEIKLPETQALIRNMFETMYAAPGIGLAAVQVGILKRIMVIDIGIEEGEVVKRDPRVVINPKFIKRQGEVIWEEGCLSCPELVVPVPRSQQVAVEFLDETGKPSQLETEDLLAVALQHEIDHMDGKLIFDYLSRLKQGMYKDKVRKGKVAVR